MSAVARDQRVAVGTFVDEIGIEIGIYGDWRLKAEFTPVFASNRNGLSAVAVQGSLRPFLFGREAEEHIFRRAAPTRDRPIVAALDAVLALRNLEHTGVNGLKLVVGADPSAAVSPTKARAAVRALAAEIDRNGLAPADVFVDLSWLDDAGEHVLNAAFEALRSRGIGIAAREKGDGIPFAGPARFPDLVMIDGGWFRLVARQPSTAQLFGALASGYRSQGTTVLVEGIATGSELRVALDAGADWLSGPLLAPARLAGAVFPEEALSVEALLDERRVIPLFR